MEASVIHSVFMPHGMCFLWQRDLLILHTLSDGITALAYLSIPLFLIVLVRRRPDFKFASMALLFAAFIVACGATHALGIWVLWQPDYYLQGVVKAITAIVSILTAAVLWPLLPRVLALPSPAQLEKANARLAEEVEVRREAQNMADNLVRNLERVIAERTARLERSNADLSSFAHVVSHDLKSPLRAIAGLSRAIEEEIADAATPSVNGYLTALRGRVERMQRMLDDLLRFSEATEDAARDSAPESLQAVVDDVLNMVDRPPGVELDTGEGLEDLEVARMPLQQVLLNLVSNAVKHRDPDKPLSVKVSARPLGDEIEICVADNGPGIDPAYHERVFEMFTTLKPRDVVEGSGAGLALVRKFVRLFGGEIHIDSSPGKGSRFTFGWPLAKTQCITDGRATGACDEASKGLASGTYGTGVPDSLERGP